MYQQLHAMLNGRFLYTFAQRSFISIYKRTFLTLQSNAVNAINATNQKCLFQDSVPNLYIVKRFKKKKHSINEKQNEVFEEEEEEEDEKESLSELEPLEKLINKNVPSMRLDGIIKAGLGMARNKIDVAFYESKIRVNGRKVVKKSMEVREGDEIDLVVGKSPENPDFLVIHRIRILSSNFVSGGRKVSLVRDKSLIIQDYERQ